MIVFRFIVMIRMNRMITSLRFLLFRHISDIQRVDVDKTPSEGLEESLIVSITEKDKRISDGVLTINRLQLDDGSDRIFGLSETVVRGLMDLGNIVCQGDEYLGKIIDSLYFIRTLNILSLLSGMVTKIRVISW